MPAGRFRYLSGVSSPEALKMTETHGLGLMLQPGSYRPGLAASYPVTAIDNGCFHPPGTPDTWVEAKWLRYLDRCDRDVLCAVAPDVPYDWTASWARSEGYIDRLRSMGFPIAVAMQNGATADDVPWDALDVVFLGGDTPWKLGTDALYIAHAAYDRGVPCHMGRANSARRMVRAVSMGGVTSADGTFLKHGPPLEMADRLRAMLDEVNRADGHQLALA